MDILITPGNLSGIVTVPPSKSFTHRAFIAAALSGNSTIENPLWADDTVATASCLYNLGFDIIKSEKQVSFIKRERPIADYFFAGESASTFRFMMPIISFYKSRYRFGGAKRLMERIYTDDLKALLGLDISLGQDYINVAGKLKPGVFTISGLKTTQIITGMILALPFLKSSKLILKDINVYDPYLVMTMEVGRHFGIKYSLTENSIEVFKGSFYKQSNFKVEGDFSNGAFWLAAAVLNPELLVSGLNPASVQGDLLFFAHLEKAGIKFRYENGCYSYDRGMPEPVEIDISRTPDLGPVLVAFFSCGAGEVIIRGIKRLEWKESNRIASVSKAINALGGFIKVSDDIMYVKGVGMLEGGCEVDGAGDHRIIMALSIIGANVRYPFVIRGSEAVNKSYRNFFEHYTTVGGKIKIL